MKKCSKCGQELDESRFSKKGTGLKSHCKGCVGLAKKKKKEETYTPEYVKKKVLDNDLHAMKQSSIMVRVVHELTSHLPDNAIWEQRLYHIKNNVVIHNCKKCGVKPRMFMQYKDEYSEFCSKQCGMDDTAERERLYKKGYYQQYKNDIVQASKKWQANHKSHRRKYCTIYSKQYHKKNPHIRAWRNCLRNSLTRLNKLKTDRTIEMLGYSAGQLKHHIESQFSKGMSWSNYGLWEVDHKIPVTAFNPTTPINVVNALNNLQPLWKEDNMEKGNKIIY